MTLKKLLLASAMASAFSTNAFAQDGGKIDGDEIVVTSRLAQKLSETGTSVSIITSDDIEEQGFSFAVDAIASAPGVTTNQSGAFGGLASVSIRGAQTAQTLVLVDGISVNDPTQPAGGFDFSSIDSESIARIEVLKGAQSTLWGSDAIGGVVNIITKSPEDGFKATAFGEYGSFNTIRGGAAVSAANETGDFRLAITHVDTDGISKADEANGNTEEDGFDSLTLSGQGGINIGNARLESRVLKTNSSTEFDSIVSGAQGNIGDGDESSDVDLFSGNVSLNLPLFDERLENIFLVGYSEIDRQNFFGGAPSFDAEGERIILRYQGTFDINDSNTIAVGAEHEDSRTGDEDVTINGLFGLYEFQPNEALTLSAGLRLDDHERFGSETTARLAAAYDVSNNVTLRGTWGQGFKAPTIFQSTAFFGPATEPNPDLMPETSDGFDFGADFQSSDGKGVLSFSYFEQSVENLIDFASGSYFNIAGANKNGVEISGNYQASEWLNISANYALIVAKDNTGQTLVRVPKNSGDLTFGLTPEGPLSGSVLIRYNGSELDSNGEVDSWVRADLNARYELNDNVELYGRVENLFDKQYQQVLGYGTPGRSGSVGIRLRY